MCVSDLSTSYAKYHAPRANDMQNLDFVRLCITNALPRDCHTHLKRFHALQSDLTKALFHGNALGMLPHCRRRGTRVLGSMLAAQDV